MSCADVQERATFASEKRGLAYSLEENSQDTVSDPYHAITNTALFDLGDTMAP